MNLIDYIGSCNRHDLQNFIPFMVDGQRVGQVRPAFADRLLEWDRVFQRENDALHLLTPPAATLEQRSLPLRQVLETLVERSLLRHLHGEQYPVTPGGPGDGLLLIDRAAAPWFGIRAFGQHMNGYVRAPEGLLMWVARRSSDRVHFPGKLDNIVAGGLPYGIPLARNLAKECWEEAGIPAALAGNARPVGAVTYVVETEKGLKPDTLYCYDLELPADFRPRCTDGEVESFQLWPVEQVQAVMQEGEAFKLNCNLVIIDFLLRHGYLGPEEKDYLSLVSGLHAPLP